MTNSPITKLKNEGFQCVVNSKENVFKFIHEINNNEHCILMFNEKKIRDEIVNEFFNPKYTYKSVTACFAHDLSKYQCNKAITYDELSENQVLIPNKITDFLIQLLDDSYRSESTRVACEDTAWFSEAGFFEEHQKLGNKLDEKIINETVMLCCYNINKINDEQIGIVLGNSKYVILDKPFSIYAKN